MNKRGLGRGLGALLSAAPGEEDELIEVPIDRVEVNPNQPRRDFDAVALDELTARDPVLRCAHERPPGVAGRRLTGATASYPDSTARAAECKHYFARRRTVPCRSPTAR